RIRNTARFLIANLYDFDPARDAVGPDALLELDQWILARTRALIERCRNAYFDYEFHAVYHALNNFCSVDLSALYLDVVKDRLYCSRSDGAPRRSAQTALWQILDVLARLMAPILSFTAEEVWGYVPAASAKQESVFLADFPPARLEATDASLLATWERLLAVRDGVTKALEEARQAGRIGHSLDARVRLSFATDGELGKLLGSRLSELPTLFIVSQVELADDLGAVAESPVVPGLRIAIERAAGQKCARCWNYRTSVGTDEGHPTICAPCVSALPDVG
ncbi:MAG TPA: class I tRNA ligase family protein, partial [Candidatus Binatia bacterium]|nr:class I tRNA ligase family protein [Candidatus Binatia bacterium]